MDSHALMLKETKQLETRLENQLSKTNMLEKFLKTKLKLQLDNIKLTINSNNNNKDTNNLNSKSNSGSIKPESTNFSNIFHGTVTVAKQNRDSSNLDFNVVRGYCPKCSNYFSYTSKWYGNANTCAIKLL